MISYHALPPRADKSDARCFSHGFKTASIDDIAREARGMQAFVWSPNIYKDGHRCEESWVSSNWLVLDFDSGETTVDQAREMFCDVRHVIGTTFSHRVSKNGEAPRDRFRVALHTERTAELRQYRHNLALLIRRYDSDPACKDGARFFYPCRDLVSVKIDGETWPLEPAPEVAPHVARAAARAEARVIPPWVLTYLSHRKWPAGERNTLCFRIGAALGVVGYEPDEIVRFIKASPTYSGSSLDTTLEREIASAVSSGVRRGRCDLLAFQNNPDK